MTKLTVTISPDIPLTAKQLGRMIEVALGHINVDVTVTPDRIDVTRGVEYTDVELSPGTYKLIKMMAEQADVPMEQILRRGNDKLEQRKRT